MLKQRRSQSQRRDGFRQHLFIRFGNKIILFCESSALGYDPFTQTLVRRLGIGCHDVHEFKPSPSLIGVVQFRAVALNHLDAVERLEKRRAQIPAVIRAITNQRLDVRLGELEINCKIVRQRTPGFNRRQRLARRPAV